VSEYDNNFNLLQKLYKIVQPADLVGRYRVEKYSNGKPDPNVLGEVLRIFVDTCDPAGSGLLQFKEIKQRLAALGDKDEMEKHVKVYDDVASVLGTLGSSSARTKLHVVSLQTPMLGISLRDTNRIGVFLNAIPSVELTRCVPRLEVNFELQFPGEQTDSDSDGKFASGLSARSPTLLRYLNGTAGAYGSADAAMAKGSVSKVDLSSRTNDSKLKESWKKSSMVTSGMELFTSPQTLTSPDSTLQARQTPVLDRFSALMSIESLEITATPAGGSFSYKTAKLNLVVHDRSRLHEVAALIRPDAYSRSTVSLTYGWSHPDGSGNNPVADLINQMVVHDEKYNIVNSTFSFGSGAGVRIVLQLAMKGASELGIVRIAENEKFQNLNLELQQLAEAIRDARARIPGLTKPEYIKEEIRAYQLIDAAANNGELIENYTAKDKEQLKKLIGKLQTGAKDKNNSAVFQDLSNVLTSMNKFLDGSEERNAYFSVDNKDKNKTPRVDDLLGDKYRAMIGHQPDGKFAAAKDPYFQKDALYWQKGVTAEDKAEIDSWMNGKSESPRKFVSLAKLLLFYVGLPLQALGTIDEVQFVYYPLNAEAGYAGATSLAGFPVEIQYFRDVLADHAKRRGNANMTIKEFVQLLNGTVLQDVRHPAYGMREVYAQRDPKKPLENPSPARGKSPGGRDERAREGHRRRVPQAGRRAPDRVPRRPPAGRRRDAIREGRDAPAPDPRVRQAQQRVRADPEGPPGAAGARVDRQGRHHGVQPAHADREPDRPQPFGAEVQLVRRPQALHLTGRPRAPVRRQHERHHRGDDAKHAEPRPRDRQHAACDGAAVQLGAERLLRERHPAARPAFAARPHAPRVPAAQPRAAVLRRLLHRDDRRRPLHPDPPLARHRRGQVRIDR
jgi:hypothetical protein